MSLVFASALAMVVPLGHFGTESMTMIGSDLEQLQELHNHSFEIGFDDDNNLVVCPARELPHEVQLELFEILHREFNYQEHTRSKLDFALHLWA
jgi:hypothetical protein